MLEAVVGRMRERCHACVDLAQDHEALLLKTYPQYLEQLACVAQHGPRTSAWGMSDTDALVGGIGSLLRCHAPNWFDWFTHRLVVEMKIVHDWSMLPPGRIPGLGAQCWMYQMYVPSLSPHTGECRQDGWELVAQVRAKWSIFATAVRTEASACLNALQLVLVPIGLLPELLTFVVFEYLYGFKSATAHEPANLLRSACDAMLLQPPGDLLDETWRTRFPAFAHGGPLSQAALERIVSFEDSGSFFRAQVVSQQGAVDHHRWLPLPRTRRSEVAGFF